jgi:tripartite-type tricarboxylate transporter receptor subunit TctC
MKMSARKMIICWIVALATCAQVAMAQSPDYPTRAIRVIVPFAAGGGSDVYARVIGQRLQEALGQSVVVDNRAGAGGNIGTELVAKSPPDGHTLMFTTSAVAINATLYPKLAVDVRKDLIAITQPGSTSSVLTVHPSVPARSVQEVVALAKRTRGGLNFASNGSGTSSHLAGIMFSHFAHAPLTHIPYKGAAPALNALQEKFARSPSRRRTGQRRCPICRRSIRFIRVSTSINGFCCLRPQEPPVPSLHG